MNVNSRLSLFPIQDSEAWKSYKEMQAMFWTAEEIDLAADYKSFQTLSEREKKLILRVLAFFAGSDAIINQNIATNFIGEIDGLEISCVYSCQQFIECVHQESYSQQIEALVKDKEERTAIINSIKTNPALKSKAEFAFKYMNKDISLPRRLFAFAIAEGLHFQASFATLAYFKTKNKLEGVTKANEFISRDEWSHCRFSALMFKRQNEKTKDMKQKDAEEIMREAVDVETKFVEDALDAGVLGLNSTLMTEFVKCVADKILVLCGFEVMFKATNPLSYMDNYGVYTKNNFFESVATNYQIANIGQSVEQRTFSLDEDF